MTFAGKRQMARVTFAGGKQELVAIFKFRGLTYAERFGCRVMVRPTGEVDGNLPCFEQVVDKDADKPLKYDMLERVMVALGGLAFTVAVVIVFGDFHSNIMAYLGGK